jgi:hypothetical protein
MRDGAACQVACKDRQPELFRMWGEHPIRDLLARGHPVTVFIIVTNLYGSLAGHDLWQHRFGEAVSVSQSEL